MATIATDLQQILDLASDYSKDATPAMLKREEIEADLAANLTSALESMAAAPSGAVMLGLRVKAGGRQAYFGALPWVRVYSPQYAPTAQEGIYLVYLFAADGSCAYLSLNQGTSELQSGRMRSITDTRVLLSRAGEARSALGDLIEAEGAAGAAMSIDLARQGLRSSDSRYKARAYEDANILAREYLSGQIPPDEQLLSDLAGMLPLLARMYGEETTVASRVAGAPDMATGAPTAPGQGRELDPVVRRKVELCAEDHAIAHFIGRGWPSFKRVGHLKLGYDLEFKNADGAVLHVEVKGTQTRGEKVVLTENEVRHIRQAAECGADHALYVLSQINVNREGEIECSGGQPKHLWPWSIANADLTPTEYSYRIPGGPA